MTSTADRHRGRGGRQLTLLFVAGLIGTVLAPITGADAQEPVEAMLLTDEWGVQHFVSEDPEAMAYAFGYGQALTRLLEMDIIRRLSQGRLSEMLGESVYEDDVYARREYFERADIERQYESLPEDVKLLIEAYGQGVNDAIPEVMTDPPSLYVALAQPPEQWTPIDTVSVLNLFTIASNAGEGEGGELDTIATYNALVARYGAEAGDAVWDDVRPNIDQGAPTVIEAVDAGPRPDGFGIVPDRPHPSQLAVGTPTANAEAARLLHAEHDRFEKLTERLPVPRVGSYAYAIDGDRTASGGGMLLGAPQVGFTFPSTFHEVGIHVPGWECEGLTVPGLGPFIGIGWCNDHAWTFVAGNQGDQVDVYVESLDPDDPGRYLHDGGSRAFTERTETFIVKSTIDGQFDVRQETFEDSVHGPVFMEDTEAGIAYTRRRAQDGVSISGYGALVALNLTVGGIPNLVPTFGDFNASFNVTLADREGNIAYTFSGLQPRRASGFDRRMAMPGTGEAEWAGFLAADERPVVVNPERGVIVVNQGVESRATPWWPSTSWLTVGHANRVGHQRQLLSDATEPWTLDLLEQRNRQIHEGSAPFAPMWADAIDTALADATDDLATVRDLWEQWKASGFARVDADEDGAYDLAGMAVFSADSLSGMFASPFRDHLWDLIFGDDLPEEGAYGTTFARLSLVMHAVNGTGRLSRSYVDDVSATIREALQLTLADLSEEFDSADPTTWRAPVSTESFSAIGISSPPPMEVYDHGSYAFLVDLAAEEGRSVVPPGNEGANASSQEAQAQASGTFPPHAVDQIELYEDWGFKPMWRSEYADHAAAERSFTYTPQGSVETGRTPDQPAPDPSPHPPAEEDDPLPATGGGIALAVLIALAAGVTVTRRRQRAAT